jgi:hypothetical protein
MSSIVKYNNVQQYICVLYRNILLTNVVRSYQLEI